MNYKVNTSDYYIHHLYTNYYKNINEALASLRNKVDFKIGTAFGNYQISVNDVFSVNGSEDLRYKNVGYGKVAFMGIAVYFEGKNMNDLFYKSAEYKKAIETFIYLIDMHNEDKQSNLKEIEKTHGKPKTEHSIIWGRVTGFLN